MAATMPAERAATLLLMLVDEQSEGKFDAYHDEGFVTPLKETHTPIVVVGRDDDSHLHEGSPAHTKQELYKVHELWLGHALGMDE